MIYCFSGTGNSRRIARKMAELLDDTVIDIDWNCSPSLPASPTEAMGLIFPIYAWGLPRVVEHFVKKIPPRANGHTPYIYSVMTCGDDIGRTDRLLRKMLAKKSLVLAAVFSLQMRNTYVCLPGFDTDSDETVRHKETKALGKLKYIASLVSKCGSSTKADLTPGNAPWIKTYVLRPLFNALLTDDKHFHSSPQLCTHCGRCKDVCPLGNIALSAHHAPQWKGHCTHCLACYHACPSHAIRYGFFTAHKGQVKINV